MKIRHLNFKELPKPAAGFSRATRVSLGNVELLFLAGTASVGATCQTRFRGDFTGQCRMAYRNIEGILHAEGFVVRDVVKWTIYLKDIRNYERFNRVRDGFLSRHGLLQSPSASTCIQAKLCRRDLLVEIEALAMRPRNRPRKKTGGYHPLG